ncbi:TrkH family potassium uptake protein [Aquiflexum gelatinilyticum]|uniref:ATPase n=1 Tax=Aquiflexum gelatinilyticum TaxID=2961943 RepID=A0A9X2P5S8_9BACT|nr:potassium transporter TrkG [Aquiflexum gelatinilyticum]MCR9016884.1 ATPase [Aquiflexum gelatinilyticum]
MPEFPFIQNPDQKINLTKKVFYWNDKILQVLSFLAFGILVFDIGFSKVVQSGKLAVFYNILLIALSVGYTIRLFSKSEKYKTPRLIIEISIILFLLTAAVLNLTGIQLDKDFRIANLQIKSFLVNLLIFILFLIELSRLSLAINKLKVHPAVVFILSFLLVIIIGTGMLMLPNATKNGISLVDALFTSTSAVCVTGLIVLDTSKDFTFMGQFIIMVLFQVGGLGMMTFTSFFGFFFKGGYSLQNQLFLKDYINEDNIGRINSTLVKIIVFTLVVEGVAALLVYSLVDKGLFQGAGDRLFFSVFHAISGFCNAGFSTLQNGLYESGFRLQYNVHLIIALTIIIGGIGFPVVVGYINYLKHVFVGTSKMIFKGTEFKHVPRVVNINIRLIVYTTFILLCIGFVSYYYFESEYTLKGLTGYGKFVTAFFGSVTPRTAGFNTVDMSALALPTILIYLILMWIGASPGSTGGGLKTSTFAVAVLNTLSVAKGKERVEVFSREISSDTIKKAFAVIQLSFLVIGLGVFLVMLFNPEMNILDVAFEIFSAFSTVGLSLGITASLSTGSKIVVTLIMFLGRVGTLTVLVAVVKKARSQNYKYPEESVFIS